MVIVSQLNGLCPGRNLCGQAVKVNRRLTNIFKLNNNYAFHINPFINTLFWPSHEVVRIGITINFHPSELQYEMPLVLQTV